MKKILSTLLIGILISSVVQAETIYENIEETVITKGVVHQSKDTYTTSGWQRANIIKVDLDDENVDLKVLTAPAGSSKLANVKKMAEHYGTKAAVNGDFFNFGSGETNMLGMVYRDGELISTPSKDNFVSFALTEDNKVFFEYFTFKGTLYAENTSLVKKSSCELYQINKVPLTTGAITMITSAWGEKVSVPAYCYAMITAPHEEGTYKMTGFSWGGESVAIPEDGAVFIANYSINGFLNSNFATGDIIRVETSVSPDIDAIKEATGGNTLIVDDGKICEFTSNIAGKAQRTGMGISQSGDTLYLVTIDGRESDCPGFTQTQLAEFMINLGCHKAINLDGGGSTTMVTQDRFTQNQTVQNSVSSLRNVSTAIGVFSQNAPSEAVMGELKLSQDTIVFGDSVEVSYVFYDKNYNNTDTKNVTITCSDPYAIISGNRVTPTSKGVHSISVSHNGVTASSSVRVLGDIFAINLYPETITSSSSKALTVTAYDKNGFSAPIPSALINYETTGDVVVENGVVKKTSDSGTITANFEGLTSVAVVNGEKYEREKDIKKTDLFEGIIPYGEKITITGAIEPSKNLLGRFQSKIRLEELFNHGDVYALSTLTDPGNQLPFYRTVDTFTERVIQNTKILTVSNLKSSSIRLSDSTAWSRIKSVCENMTQKNLVLIINKPVYNMDSGEQEVFKHFMTTLTQKGVNVFVVSTGVKSEVTVEDGIRYFYLGSLSTPQNRSFEYDLFASSPLSFTFSGDEIKYTFN